MSAAAEPREHERLGKLFDRLQHQLHLHGAYNLDHKIERVLAGLGFGADCFQQADRKLSAEGNKIGSCGANLLAEPDVMLLDEPSKPSRHRSDRVASKTFWPRASKR